jgi:hypothetical protein
MHQRPSIVERLNVDSQTEPFQRCVKDPKTPGAEGWNMLEQVIFVNSFILIFLEVPFDFERSLKTLVTLRQLRIAFRLSRPIRPIRFRIFRSFLNRFRIGIAAAGAGGSFRGSFGLSDGFTSGAPGRASGHLGIWASVFQDLSRSFEVYIFYQFLPYFIIFLHALL